MSDGGVCAQASLLLDMLPEVVVLVDSTIAEGLSHYLRAQQRRFRGGSAKVEATEYLLPGLDSAATEGAALAALRQVQAWRRPEVGMTPLLKLMTSTADNYAIPRSLATAAAGSFFVLMALKS